MISSASRHPICRRLFLSGGGRQAGASGSAVPRRGMERQHRCHPQLEHNAPPIRTRPPQQCQFVVAVVKWDLPGACLWYLPPRHAWTTLLLSKSQVTSQPASRPTGQQANRPASQNVSMPECQQASKQASPTPSCLRLQPTNMPKEPHGSMSGKRNRTFVLCVHAGTKQCCAPPSPPQGVSTTSPSAKRTDAFSTSPLNKTSPTRHHVTLTLKP